MKKKCVLLLLLLGVLIFAFLSCDLTEPKTPAPTPPGPENTINYTLSYSCTPEKGGAVSCTPEGQSFKAGTSLELTAEPKDGFRFDHWEGDTSSTENPLKITLNSNTNVSAVFVRQYSLDVTIEGHGDVVETLLTNKAIYDENSTVNLEAQADSGWEFDHWEIFTPGVEEPAIFTDNSINVNINSNHSVTAVFTEKEIVMYSVKVLSSPETGGVVLCEPEGEIFPENTMLSLRAQANSGYRFDHWEGDVSSEDNPLEITLNSDTTVSAVYIKLYDLEITVEGEGTVVETLVSSKALYDENSIVNLEAQPEPEWQFDHWEISYPDSSEAETFTEPSINIDIESDVAVLAVFVKKVYSWNFLVYLDGDNDLETYAIDDMNEIETMGSSDDVNVLVLLDRISGYDSSNGNWTGTRLYKITRDDDDQIINSELLVDYGELAMDDPETLETFIVYAQTHYLAEKTVLNLWNHGGGVYPRSVTPTELNPSKGICFDDTSGDSAWDCLTTDEVAAAMEGARSITGQMVDIINIDACTTQMLEMAYEWKNESSFMVGSQANVPFAGNDYLTLLGKLTENPTMPAQDYCEILVSAYLDYYSSKGADVTYSAIKLGSSMDDFMVVFTDFSEYMYNLGDLEDAKDAWLSSTTFDMPELMDLYSFADNLSQLTASLETQTKAEQLIVALDELVLSSGGTGSYENNVHGISILMPIADFWSNYAGQNQYSQLLLAQDTQWDEFIIRFADDTESGLVGSKDSLVFSITWASDVDCDLLIFDPGNPEPKKPYQTINGITPNGVFSEDQTGGGTETWTLKQPHMVGSYQAAVINWDETSTAVVLCEMRVNDVRTVYQVIRVNPYKGNTTNVISFPMQWVKGSIDQLKDNFIISAK